MAENQAKINLNEASRDELDRIEGVGRSVADEIVRYRESNGRINDFDELCNIPRMADTMVEKLREQATL